MHAAWYERTGEAEAVLEVGEIPDPEPGPGELRVRVHVSGVNPADVKRRSGWGGIAMEFPRVIPHDDGAGIVDAVGPGVDSSRIGERVWLWDTRVGRATGSAAEHVCVPARNAESLPDEIDFAQGACLSTPARTAHQCLVTGDGVAGKTVLVAGAGGAVGEATVQLARAAGATLVIGTTGRPQSRAIAEAAGCDLVLDYRIDDLAAAVMDATSGRGVDRVAEVDLAANIDLDSRICAVGGTIAYYASDSAHKPVIPVWRLLSRTIDLTPVLLYNLTGPEQRRAASDVGRWLSEGRLRSTIGRRFALAEVAAAHTAVEQRTFGGNVVIELA
ncbi:2-haloacrylate reductase [Paraconexibacter sp. AEG42_29]|uniref:2-haloacrylate reductase n=1 Tax=Paraconexibacter sp. AEG42_29 TaxID=2997339 RepID=A0AAU7ATR1_9ACTN